MASKDVGRRIGRLRGEARQREIDTVLNQWRASDLSKVRFCKSQGISTQTLRRWLVAVPAVRSPEAPRPAFIEVKAPRAETMYEIVLGSGACVRIPAGFDEGEVARLLCAARSC